METPPAAPNFQPVAGGAVRCADNAAALDGHAPRFDLVMNNEVGFMRLAQTYGEGSKKYGDHNWKKGLPESNLLDHALAHIHQHLKGDTTEDHLAHACWNIYTLMWMQVKRPDLMDLQRARPVEPPQCVGVK